MHLVELNSPPTFCKCFSKAPLRVLLLYSSLKQLQAWRKSVHQIKNLCLYMLLGIPLQLSMHLPY